MKTCSLIILSIFFISAGASGQTFYDHYNNGLKSIKKERWEEAVTCFKDAIRLKEDDAERVRTYGVNFIDYFPNRELGIAYYELVDHTNARIYLERSQLYQPSGRAADYLSRIPATATLAQEEDVIKEKDAGTIKEEGLPVEKESQPSGEKASQASNQKASQPSGEKVVAAALVADNTKPSIFLTYPPQLDFRSLNPVTNETKKIIITGRVEDKSGIYEVLVNGKDAVLAGSGEFQAVVYLSVGSNNVSISATDIHQNTAVRDFTIIREDMTVAKNDLLEEDGKYYALIIGVSDYIDPQIPDLDGLPISDASLLARTLMEKYTFEKENVLLLKNPNRTEILRAFDYLSQNIREIDNLLIFYAGHGYYDEKTELGYWLPADAEANFTANWIYNDVLVANLKRMQSKHTLLISDACFSGSIFKTRALVKDAPMAYKKKYELPSRKAITSGVLKTVPNKSVFFKYLAEGLEKNDEVYLSASQLFQGVEIPVANNSPNTPQYGDIQNVGDEGGDFIFIRR